MKKILFIPILLLMFMNNVHAEENTELYNVVTCGDIELPDGVVGLISTAITILQIAVPIILIIMGMLDFAKATAASKEEDMKKAQQSFVRRLIAGAAVFFVIFIVRIVVGILNTDDSNQTLVCVDKILNGKTNTEKKNNS